eukprot:SAG31_NODE_16541_length_705_cov_0.760726_1_plen_157_part_10
MLLVGLMGLLAVAWAAKMARQRADSLAHRVEKLSAQLEALTSSRIGCKAQAEVSAKETDSATRSRSASPQLRFVDGIDAHWQKRECVGGIHCSDTSPWQQRKVGTSKRRWHTHGGDEAAGARLLPEDIAGISLANGERTTGNAQGCTVSPDKPAGIE